MARRAALNRVSGKAATANPIAWSSSGGRYGVLPPSRRLIILGPATAPQNARISLSSARASMKWMSAPAAAKASARARASSKPWVARASVRARIRMSRPSSLRASLASTAARIRVTASARSTTSLPAVWPQRLGARWSSIMTAAKPAWA